MDPTTNEQNQQLTTLADDETDSLTTNLDRTADTGNDVQQQSVAARQLATLSRARASPPRPRQRGRHQDRPPVADTPDATPPAARRRMPTRRRLVRHHSVAVEGPQPIGADRPKLNHPAPAIKRAFTKPDKRDATDGDDTSQDATKTVTPTNRLLEASSPTNARLV
jgi:hypothetical protein